MDRNQFQPVFVCHLTEFGQTCHCSVFTHDFHQGTCGVKSCQTSHINRSFCMSGTAKYSFFLRVQRIDVSGTPESSRCRSRIGQRLNSSGTVGSGNTCCTAFQFVNGNRKRSSQHGSIVTYLMRQIQLLATRHCDRCTKYATCMFQHEIYFFGSYLFSCNNQVAFVFAVFIIHYYDKLAFFEVGNRIFYSIHFNSLFHNTYLLIFCMMN